MRVSRARTGMMLTRLLNVVRVATGFCRAIHETVTRSAAGDEVHHQCPGIKATKFELD